MNPSIYDKPVVIVGAGVTGLVSAHLLAELASKLLLSNVWKIQEVWHDPIFMIHMAKKYYLQLAWIKPLKSAVKVLP